MGASDKTKFNFATWKMLHMKRNIFWLFTMCSSYVLAAAAQHFVCCRLTFGHHGLQRAQPNQRCEQTQTLWTCFRVAIIWDQDVWVRSQHLQTSASAGGGCPDHWPRKRGKFLNVQTFQMATDMYISHFLFQELQQLKTDLEQVLALTQDLINAQLGASAGKGWVEFYKYSNRVYWEICKNDAALDRLRIFITKRKHVLSPPQLHQVLE